MSTKDMDHTAKIEAKTFNKIIWILNKYVNTETTRLLGL